MKPAALALAICLAGLAGWVDATGYIHFHTLFVSFMSGNSTEAAVAAAKLDASQVVELGRIILLFVAGVSAGELAASAAGRRWHSAVVLAAEVALLGATVAAERLHIEGAVLASCLALTMGLQNAVLHKAGDMSVSVTFVTGTLVQVGRRCAAALRGAEPWRALVPHLGLWAGLVCGGLIGATIADRSLATALLGATGFGAALLAVELASAVRSPVQPS